MEAQVKYEHIKSTAGGHTTKHTASIKISCTIRHVNRLLNNYHKEGQISFVYGNKGRKTAHALSDQQKTKLIAIYNVNCWNANSTHCCKLSKKHDSIIIFPFCLRKLLYRKFILSPWATRRTHKHMKVKGNAIALYNDNLKTAHHLKEWFYNICHDISILINELHS